MDIGDVERRRIECDNHRVRNDDCQCMGGNEVTQPAARCDRRRHGNEGNN
jgi:hypothetical protein